MSPKILYNGVRPLFVLVDEEGVSDVERELEQLKAERQTLKKVAALEIMMERFADGERLTAEMFHNAGECHGIKVMEFIKNPIRIYCLQIPESKGAVLLTHAILKKWQKTKPQDLEKAVMELRKLPPQWQLEIGKDDRLQTD